MALPLTAPSAHAHDARSFTQRSQTRINTALSERQLEQKKLLTKAFFEFKQGNVGMAKTLAAFLCEAYADPDAYMVLAASAHKLGDEKVAADAYEAALTHKPDDLNLNVGYAELCIKLMRYDVAKKHIEHCFALDPKSQHPAGAKARVLVLKVEQMLANGHQ
jgi:Tfp pilus assembly protein PilF